MNEMSWFPHPIEHSLNIQAMLREYDNWGYGLYWKIIEQMYREQGHRLPHKHYVYDGLAKKDKAEDVEIFIRDSIDKYELFQSDGNYFWSDEVLEQVEYHRVQKEKFREAGRRGGLNRAKNAGQSIKSDFQATLKPPLSEAQATLKRGLSEAQATLNPPSSDPQAIPSTYNNNIDNSNNSLTVEVSKEVSKQNKSKTREAKIFVPPTQLEVKQYFWDKGQDPDRGAQAWDYYDATDWHDKDGHPVKNWKAKMVTVWFKSENKIQRQIGWAAAEQWEAVSGGYWHYWPIFEQYEIDYAKQNWEMRVFDLIDEKEVIRQLLLINPIHPKRVGNPNGIELIPRPA